MANASPHLEWLSLVEVSGPFLAASVLDVAFPQGLESIDSSKRQRIRAAYEEWQDAVDQQDPLLADLHAEWIRLILVDVLEYDPESLLPASWPDDTPSVTSDDGTLRFAPTWIIQSPSTKQVRAFVTVVPPGTDLESIGPQATWATTLRERMTALCRSRGVRIGLLTNGERWMVVNAPTDSTSGQGSWYARFWSQEPLTLRAFQGLLNVRRCFGPAEGTLEELLEESIKHQDEVTTTLGEQVRRAVEMLVQALDRADEDRDRDLLRDTTPAELYEAGLTVMMRLVFILCAEERGLLLLGDPLYDEAYAVSTLRGQLADDADRYGPEVLERRHDAWSRLLALFRAIFAGVDHEDMRLPAMGGSLFDPDRFPFLEGRAAGTSWTETSSVPVPIDNRTVLRLLTSLQVLQQAGGALNLSYRALDVEQIGYVYEGLLEQTVVRVPQVTIGLRGSSKSRYPNLPLSELESARMAGDERLSGILEQATGRSAAAIRADMNRMAPRETLGLILDSVSGDQVLSRRVEPFASLLRQGARGGPIIYRQGAFMVAGGTERRETGTHYTPKSLTEEIVQTTLEPTVYLGPSEGRSRSDWVLKSPEELLALKICDPAMGSGAFLVQACRYLADRLVEAWSLSEEKGGEVLATGTVVSRGSSDELLSPLPSERQIAARKLVAERCLYGVDVNPMAVELAKLSIWLVTLAKGRPFDFLDHNLRAGDSLLGVHDLRQLAQLDLKPAGAYQPSIFGQRVEDAVADAVRVRQELRGVVVRDIADVEAIATLNMRAHSLIEQVELVADCLVGEAINGADKPAEFSAARSRLAIWADLLLTNDEDASQQLNARVTWLLSDGLPTGSRSRRPFHWALEFPEVFGAGGFHAIIGNPPFLGNRLWKSMLGSKMQAEAKIVLGAAPGKIDLCVVFHRRAMQLLRDGGCYGLLGRDNITEGSAVDVGLGAITAQNDIFYARKRVPWLGKASVLLALVCCAKGAWGGRSVAG